MVNLDKNIEIGMMLDFYGQLLTDRQEEIVQMYYNNDLSLGEISQNLGITRQGVFDNLKRSEKALFEMERKLGLVQRFLDQKRKILQVLDVVNEIENDVINNNVEEICNKINQVRNTLSFVLED